MDELTPELVTAQEKQIVALSRTFTLDTRDQIPALWQTWFESDWHLNEINDQASYGIPYAMQADGTFHYGVGLSVSTTPEEMPEDACIMTLSAGNYLVFRQQGPVRDIPLVFDTLFGEWLPNSDYIMRDSPVFERYPFTDSTPDSMAYEIWVPVG